jgi:DNA repair protein RecO (recombination protein O)
MATYKAKSIIIKSYRLGESDKIIKLYSMESGIISAVAKGAFNLKSKFSGRLELYNIIDCEISSGRNLDIITQVEIIEAFKNISCDFFKFSISQIISEIILKTQSEKSPSINIFKLLYVTFKEINKANAEDNLTLKKILIFFLAKFLKIMGYVPLFDYCSICGNKLSDEDLKYERKGFIFSIKYGGAICNKCRKNIDRLLFIGKDCLDIFMNLFYIKIERLPDLNISEKNTDVLLNIIENYFIYHLDIKIESFDYLKKIEKIKL